MNDEQYLLASAYVDGEVTDEERQIAERDPAVMAEVATIRATRGAVADVPPPTDDTRRTAIAAAMAEYKPAATSVTTPAEPVRDPERVAPIGGSRGSTRWLQIAAVAVGVGLAGVIISQGIGTGDDDAADSEPAAAEIAAEDGGLDRAMVESDAETSAEAPMDEDVDEAVDEAVDEPAEELAEAAASEAANVGDGDARDASGEEAERGSDLALGFAERGYSARLDVALIGRNSTQPITTEAELIEFGRAVSDAAASDLPEPELPPLGECVFDEPVLADAYVDVGTGPVLALVGIDNRLLIIRAYDPATCLVLIEV